MEPDNTALFTGKAMNLISMFHKTFFQCPHSGDLMLPSTQMQVLVSLTQNSPLNMTQLADQLHISKQQLTKVVDALVEKQLVSRGESERNRRMILIEMTDVGRMFLSQAIESRSQLLNDMLGGLSAEERKTLEDAFHILKKAFALHMHKNATP